MLAVVAINTLYSLCHWDTNKNFIMVFFIYIYILYNNFLKLSIISNGAGDGAWTRNNLLGRQELYQLSYSRIWCREQELNPQPTDLFTNATFLFLIFQFAKTIHNLLQKKHLSLVHLQEVETLKSFQLNTLQ